MRKMAKRTNWALALINTGPQAGSSPPKKVASHFNGFLSIGHIRALYSRSSVVLLQYEGVENGFRRESCFVHRREGRC